MKKQDIFLVLFLLFILFSFNFILAEEDESIPQDDEITINKLGKPLIREGLDPITKENINNLVEYITKNFPADTQGNKGKIKVDAATGEIVIIPSQTGKEFARIPKGFLIESNANDFVVKGSGDRIQTGTERVENPKTSLFEEVPVYKEVNLVIDGNTFLVRKSAGESATISLKKTSVYDKTVKSIVFDGIGEVIGVYHNAVFKKKAVYTISGEGEDRVFDLKGEGDLVINGAYLTGVKNGLFKIDKNKQIYYAKFTAMKDGNYNFNYNGKNFLFKAKAGGQFIFNPREGVIFGEGGDFYFGNKEKNDLLINAANNFVLNVDISGEVLSINLKKGDYFSSRSSELEKITSLEGDFQVFFDKLKDGKDNLKSYGGNGVLVKEDGSVELKGFIKASAGNLNYNGLEKGSYSIFNSDDKKYGGYSFRVLDGDASMEDLKHFVLIKDGNSFVKIKNINSLTNSFSFYYTNKKGEQVEGFFYEGDGRFKLTEGDREVISIPYSNLLGKTVSTEIASLEYQKSEIENKIQLDNLKKSVTSIDDALDKLKKDLLVALDEKEIVKINSAIEKLTLEKFSRESQLLKLQEGGNRDTLIKNIEGFLYNLNGERSFELSKENNAALYLLHSELLLDKAREINVPKTIEIRAATSPVAWTSLFPIIENGQITGFRYGDKINEHEPSSTFIPKEQFLSLYGESGLYKPLVEELNRVGWDINKVNWQGLGSGFSLNGEIKFDYASKEYQELLKLVRMKDSASEGAFAGGLTSSLVSGQSDSLKLSQALLRSNAFELLRDFKSAQEEIQKLVDSSSGEQQEFFQAKLDLLKFRESPGKYGLDSLESLGNQYLANNDEDSRQQLLSLQKSLLQMRRDIYGSESQRLLDQLDQRLGSLVDADGNAKSYWQVAGLAFKLPSTYYNIAKGGGVWQNELSERLSENDVRIAAAYDLRALIESGQDTRNFFQSNRQEQILTMSDIYGLGLIVSREDVEGYMKRESINLDVQDDAAYDVEVKKLLNAIAEDKGSVIAGDYAEMLRRATLKLELLNNGVKNNADLYAISMYSGDTSLGSYAGGDIKTAFSSSFAGKSLSENSATENFWLGVADFTSSMLIFGAAGKALGGIAELTGTSRFYNGFRYAFNPGEAAASAAGRTGLKGLLTELGVDIPYGIVSSQVASAIDPRFGAVVDILSGATGINSVKGMGREFSGVIRTADGIIPSVKFESEEAMKVFAKSKGLGDAIESGVHIINGEKVFLHSTTDQLDNTIKELEATFETAADIRVAAREVDGQLLTDLRLIEERLNAARSEIGDAATSSARNAETSGCFLAGTPIMLANGYYKNIENMKEGDSVKAFDLVNNRVVDAEVTKTFVRKANSYRIIEYETIN